MDNIHIIITINEYPIGWEWLDRVPLEDFNWLVEVFSTLTDNTNVYEFASYDKLSTDESSSYSIIEINRKDLAGFLNEDQGYEGGIREYGHYIAAKCLNIKSEEEYLNHFTDIELICNEL